MYHRKLVCCFLSFRLAWENGKVTGTAELTLTFT